MSKMPGESFFLPKLYGHDTNGKLKEWRVYTSGDEVVIDHGLVDGKKQERRFTCEAKNIGRANETTPAQQAKLEAESRWKKQKDKNYHEDPDNIVPLMNPMLAKDYNKEGHRIQYPCSIQPKLDGVRALAYLEGGKIVYRSRGGKYYPNIKEIDDEIGTIFEKNNTLVLDGELYCHDMILQDIVSAVKKHNSNTHKIQYHIFDVATEQFKWNARLRLLNKMIGYIKSEQLERVRVVPTQIISNPDEMKSHHKTYVQVGYEGVMLRNQDGMYKFNHRSPDLQKFKTFQDSEFLVIGVEQDAYGHGVCILKVKNDLIFKAKLAGNDRERTDVWENRDNYIGQYATVKYQAFTKDGVPQFPVLVAFRDMVDNKPVY